MGTWLWQYRRLEYTGLEEFKWRSSLAFATPAVLFAVQNNLVYLAMQGACDGCPSSTATLKHGIEGLLKHYVPEVVEVRAS